jgi:hypothetical protein
VTVFALTGCHQSLSVAAQQSQGDCGKGPQGRKTRVIVHNNQSDVVSPVKGTVFEIGSGNLCFVCIHMCCGCDAL